MSKKSKRNPVKFVAVESKVIAEMIEAEAAGVVKESRTDGHWERKQLGKNRDMSRREMRREHNVNRRKSSR